uniref:Uncharacterized protein n=1 Tax=Anguilla anguilla TaxID=7936 RepID=A0A0E9RFM4_ANGAN
MKKINKDRVQLTLLAFEQYCWANKPAFIDTGVLVKKEIQATGKFRGDYVLL